jgi:hypothetical protein
LYVKYKSVSPVLLFLQGQLEKKAEAAVFHISSVSIDSVQLFIMVVTIILLVKILHKIFLMYKLKFESRQQYMTRFSILITNDDSFQEFRLIMLPVCLKFVTVKELSKITNIQIRTTWWDCDRKLHIKWVKPIVLNFDEHDYEVKTSLVTKSTPGLECMIVSVLSKKSTVIYRLSCFCGCKMVKQTSQEIDLPVDKEWQGIIMDTAASSRPVIPEVVQVEESDEQGV